MWLCEIPVPLGMIYTKSLAEGVVPREWKTADVTPLGETKTWSGLETLS